MTNVSGVIFTREDLERYAKWKENWLKEQGKTEAELDKDIKDFQRRLG